MRASTLLPGLPAVLLALALPARAQQPIAYVPVEGVTLSGTLNVSNGRAAIGTSGTITSTDRTAHVSLVRGGEIRLCATTTAHLSADSSISDAASTAILLALDRGAIEADYTTGKFSDVLMTPDLRILVSGPGKADLRLRVNSKGDTCIDNHGADAPYVTVSSQFEGGAYRVQPNQRVLFEHGSLRDVVDNEQEPCGCPSPAVSVATSGTAAGAPAKPGQTVGGPSSTPADTAFPLAQSEGLAPPPPLPTQPIVPGGEAHAQVSVPLAYNGANPAPPPPPSTTAPATIPASHGRPSSSEAPTASPSTPAQSQHPAEAQAAPAARPAGGGFFKRLGHALARLFGG